MTAKEHAIILALGISENTPREKVGAIAVLLDCKPEEIPDVTGWYPPKHLLEAAKDVKIL